MPENYFEQNPDTETEEFKRALAQEIEKIDDLEEIKDVLRLLNISGIEDINELNTAKEFLQSNVRGSKKSELFIIQNKIQEAQDKRSSEK